MGINGDVLNVKQFELIPKLIGHRGQNTRDIWEQTDTKVRIRGRGSGHVEMHTGREAIAHLMMAVTADHGRKEDFRTAVELVKSLLEHVFARFDAFCQQRGLPKYRDSFFWMGELSSESEDCLTGLSFPPPPKNRLCTKSEKTCQ